MYMNNRLFLQAQHGIAVALLALRDATGCGAQVRLAVGRAEEKTQGSPHLLAKKTQVFSKARKRQLCQSLYAIVWQLLFFNFKLIKIIIDLIFAHTYN